MANTHYRFQATATIAASGTTSTAVDLSDYLLTAISFPAMTGTSVTFTGSADGVTYVPIADETDTNLPPITVSATAKIRKVDPAKFAGIRFIKAVSGSSEASARTLTFLGYKE